jgi:hypothetical protein
MYARKKYKEMAKITENLVQQARSQTDIDYSYHFSELDRYELNSTEWVTHRLEQPKHDYTSKLLDRYLDDIRERQARTNMVGSSFSAQVRKPIKLNLLEELIEENTEQIIELNKSAAQKEVESLQRNRQAAHEARVSFIVNNRLGFKKEKAMKRSNSFDPKVELFGDMDDYDFIKKTIAAANRDADTNRGRINCHMSDVPAHRYEKQYDGEATESLKSELFEVTGDDVPFGMINSSPTSK